MGVENIRSQKKDYFEKISATIGTENIRSQLKFIADKKFSVA